MLQNSNPEGGLKYIEELTTNADQVQQEVLEKILAQNRETEYLSGILNGSVDKNAFKNKVPFVEYEDIKPYIERIANGEPSRIISAQPITELLTSSGTSGGQQKMLPSTAEDWRKKAACASLITPVNKYVGGLDKGKSMFLMFVRPEIRTPSGLMGTTVLTSFYKSKHFKNMMFDPFSVFTSPSDIFLCLDGKQSMYCQLLCGLAQRDEVIRVGASFAYLFLRAIKFLEDHFKELCSNIRTGALSDWIIDPGCRKSVSTLILGSEPNPDLADLLEFECTNSKSWEGIIKKLWPKTKYIDAIITGSMAQYIPALEFYGGGLPLVSSAYASSECFMGINLEPLCNPYDVSYTILPHMAYFEFLPIANATTTATTESEVVDLTNVKIGHQYEIVVTTFTGLYRYRVGDILMVTGFHNKAPKFKFIRRSNMVLNIDSENTTEEDLLTAITKTRGLIEPLGFLLTEYTSYADISSTPGHYVLYWELKSTNQDAHISKLFIDDGGSIMEKCCEIIEESLDSVYRMFRKRDNSIGALEIRVVKHGTFDALMDFFVSRGSSASQYKTPRCIKSEEALKILDATTLGRFSSQKVPFWEPLGTPIN